METEGTLAARLLISGLSGWADLIKILSIGKRRLRCLQMDLGQGELGRHRVQHQAEQYLIIERL